MRILKVTLSYRGTRYHGFQRQENAHTVQEEVERCLSQILGGPHTLHGCSRTDTGVHALEFVFHVPTESRIPLLGFQRGMNKLLPLDISVLNCEEADPDFHARFSCVGKEYLYRIHNRESKDPFTEDFALHVRSPIQDGLLRKAAEDFLGTHDFSAFCASGSNKKDHVRTIYRFDLERHGEKLDILVRGDGFLYHMVRIMVGTLLEINEGKIPPDGIPEILASQDRLRAGRTARACGLYLKSVFYRREDLLRWDVPALG